MSIGSWDPQASTSAEALALSAAILQRCIGYSRDEQLTSLPEHLDGDDSQVLAGLMKIDHAQWSKTCEELSDDEIIHLIRFFAVAENLPGWEAGADSPVIPLAKALRKRGQRLDKSLLLWLREVNVNRYLPYGPL